MEMLNEEFELVPEAETKRERFERKGKQRMEKVLKDIRLLGNLSNRYSYDWSQRDVEKMHIKLVAAIDEMLQRFREPNRDDSFDW